MKNDSRTINSLRNIIIGILSQVITILLLFVSRSVFLDKLGIEYLGIHSFFTNVITILTMAELGITNVFLYSLYKPLKDQNLSLVSSLVKYFNKIFLGISSIILIIGICFIPFLHYFIQTDISNSTIVSFYLLFLVNSASSFLVVHKLTLINADQKFYIVKLVTTIILVVKEIIQILILIYNGNYFIYLIVLILSTVFTNIVLNFIANKLYPFLNERKKIELNKTEIINQIKSIFLYKFGVVIFNNTDYILISTLLGVVTVGYYANYSMIITAVITMMSILIQSIMASVGNLNADNNLEKSYNTFNFLLFTFHMITTWCSLCLYVALDTFIILWLGDTYVLDKEIVLVIIANFYLQNIINPVWMYRETMGLFNEIKYVMIIASIVNIILSVILGSFMGLFGVLIATLVARLVTTVWYEPRMLFKSKFKRSSKLYWGRQFKYIAISLLSTIIVVGLTFFFTDNILSIFIKLLVVTMVVFIVFTLFFYKYKEYQQILRIFTQLIRTLVAKFSFLK